MTGEDAEALMPDAAGVFGRCDVDFATGEVTLTAPLRKLFGFAEAGRLSLDDIRARTHPADRQRIAEEMAAALDDSSKASVRTRFRIQRQDGSTVWLEAHERILRDGDGRAIRTAGVMHAVTGRKRAEPPEDQSWRRFEAALANTSVVVFQQDLALRYTWIHNPKLGFDAQSVLGKTDCELTGPELARPLDAIKRGVIETGQSARREVTMQGPGARGRYNLYVEPRRDESGAIVGITCAAREIAVERGGAGAPSKLRQAISDRDALLDRIGARNGARNDTGADCGLFAICIDVLRRKLTGYATLTREDIALLGLMEKKRRFVPARQRVEIGASSANRPWLIGNGWVYSYRTLASGERQVMGFHLPGDLIGASGPGGDRAGTSHVAVTDCVLCEFDRAMVMKLRRSETMLPDALNWCDAREEAILQQHLISVGRRSAIARVAHLLLELGARLKLVGLADDAGYTCPLSQELLGDALGLTKIHINRMLRELRELGCLTFRNGEVSFGDMARLTELAEYDAAYLDLRVQGPQPQAGMQA
jgi:PAS domain S-box-containing protein